MAVSMKVKLTDEEVKILEDSFNSKLSIRNLRDIGIKSVEEWNSFKRDIRSSLIVHIVTRSGYHPNGYGLWNERIEKVKDEYYLKWNRSNTCD